MPSAAPAPTLREKVLAWLAHVDERLGESPGVATTQPGIAAAVGMSRAHVTRTAGALVADGLATGEDARVPGFARAVKAYRLTLAGRVEASRLSTSLASSLVEARRFGASPERATLGDAMARATPRLTLWEALDQLARLGHVDLDGARATRTVARFAFDLADAGPEALLVGRDEETAAFRAWLAASPRVLVVEAPGGIGKTAFVAHALRAARPRAHVVWFRVTEAARAESLRARLDDLGAELGRPGALADLDDPEPLTAALVARFKGLPIVVVVDDAHKADAATRRLVTALARVAEALPTFRLVAIGREVELPEDVLRRAVVARLPLLPDADAKRLLAARGVAESETPRLVAAARGNPLFLHLLAERPDRVMGPAGLPEYLASALLPSLARSEAEALRWISAMRGPIEPLLLALVGAGSDSALTGLARAGLLAAREDGAFDAHDLVREAVYLQLEYRERRRIHERLAAAYRPVEDDWSEVGEHLHHLVAAGQRDDALRWVLRNKTRFLEAAREIVAGEREA